MGKTNHKRDFRIPLRAVVYQQGEYWIAHCLELDLVAEGKSPQEAISDLIDIANTQVATAIESGDLESVFRAAPPEIWAMYSRATDTPVKKKPLRPIERFEAREAALT